MFYGACTRGEARGGSLSLSLAVSVGTLHSSFSSQTANGITYEARRGDEEEEEEEDRWILALKMSEW